VEEPVLQARPLPARSAARRRWNRGAYLAEALAAVPTATPTATLLGAEQVGHPYAGACATAGTRPRSTSALRRPLDRGDVFTFLRPATARRTACRRPMRAVVRGLAKLPDDDLRALAHYFVSLNTRRAPPRAEIARAPVADAAHHRRGARGHKLYSDNCASCHGAPGESRRRRPLAARA
jgi:nicotinate dehydrogenase subunit B